MSRRQEQIPVYLPKKAAEPAYEQSDVAIDRNDNIAILLFREQNILAQLESEQGKSTAESFARAVALSREIVEKLTALQTEGGEGTMLRLASEVRRLRILRDEQLQHYREAERRNEA